MKIMPNKLKQELMNESRGQYMKNEDSISHGSLLMDDIISKNIGSVFRGNINDSCINGSIAIRNQLQDINQSMKQSDIS
jgi:hypothetical protein